MIALLKLIVVFVGIVLLLSRKWNLGLVLLLASLALGLLFAHPLLEVGRDVLQTSVDVLTLRLMLAVVLIMTLSELLRQTAGLQGMVESLQTLTPNERVVIAALPSLVGLLPVVGGAMFSAPMVDEIGNQLEINEERKTFINYWFRHMWELVYPLYPSMMLGAALLGLTTTQLAGATWPLTVAAGLGGLIFGLLGLSRRSAQDAPSPPRAQSLRTLATSIWPILLFILLSLTMPVDERFSVIISLLITIVLVMVTKHVPLRDLGTILRQRIPLNTLVVIFGALTFRRVLENSGAVFAVAEGLTDLHIPVPVVAFGVPFIAGWLTGLLTAAYSIGFPVVLPLVIAGGGTITPGWAAWLMTGGFLGIMLSPMHLCLALTRVYFKAEWGPVYRRVVPSALLIAGTAAGILLLG